MFRQHPLQRITDGGGWIHREYAIGRYLDSLARDHGALLIFDRRSGAGPLEERSEMSELEHGGRRIRVLRL